MSLIRQYHIQAAASLPPEAAYAFYSAMLAQAPEASAKRIHEAQIPMVGQYTHGKCWVVSLLGREAVEAFAPVLETMASVTLYRTGQTVSLLERSVRQVDTVEELLAVSTPKNLRLRFLTPTAFKSGGHYQLLPTQRLLLQSLIQKWNGCFGAECPIEIEDYALDGLAQELVYGGISLNSRPFPLKHTTIPGITGTIDAELFLRGEARQIVNGLLQFGTFSGVGIKTTLGMGGFIIEQK